METPQHCSLLHAPDYQKSCAPSGELGHTPDLRQEIRRYQSKGTKNIGESDDSVFGMQARHFKGEIKNKNAAERGRAVLAQSGWLGSSSAQVPLPPLHAAQTANETSPRKRCLVEPTKNFPENMEKTQNCSLLHAPDCQKSCAPSGEPGHTPDLRQVIRGYQTKGTENNGEPDDSVLGMQARHFIARCALPDWDNDTYTIQSEQHARAVNAAIPEPVKGTQLYSSCLIFHEINDSRTGYEHYTNTTQKCDRWVYDHETYGSTIVTKFNWVCDMLWTKSHAQMMFMLGSLVGCVVLVSPSDFLGRKKMFLVSVLLHVIAAISVAFAPSFAVLGILFFVNGMATIAVWSNAFVVGVELVGPSRRAWTGIICELFWTVGNFITVTTAYFVRNWQHVQLIVSVPSVLFLSYYWLMPESPRWLISKKKYEEADRILRHAAKVNKKTLPFDLFTGSVLSIEKEEPLWRIFTSPTLVIRSLIIFLNWLVCSLGFYGLGLNVASLGGSVYTNFFISSVAEIVGNVSCLLLLNRVGRKSLHCTAMILGGICCTATIIPVLLVDKSLTWLTIALALTGRAFVVASFSIIWLYASELFPTVIRNSALAAANVCARVGGTISPYIANLSLVVPGDFGRALPLIIFGTSMAAAGLLALLLPETLNRNLPETINDARKMKRLKRNSESMHVDNIHSKEEEMVQLNSCTMQDNAKS